MVALMSPVVLKATMGGSMARMATLEIKIVDPEIELLKKQMKVVLQMLLEMNAEQSEELQHRLDELKAS